MVATIHAPDPIDVHVGARLRMRRLQVGMNQESLAKAINVTFQQVQKYERGANRLSASRLYRCAQTLGVSPGWFFEELPDGDGDMRSSCDPEASGTPFMTAQSLELVTMLPDISPKIRGAILGLARALTKGGDQVRRE